MKYTKSFNISDFQKPDEGSPNLTSKGRKKFTTMMRTDIRVKLGNLAKNNKISIADAIEIIFDEYFKNDTPE